MKKKIKVLIFKIYKSKIFNVNEKEIVFFY